MEMWCECEVSGVCDVVCDVFDSLDVCFFIFCFIYLVCVLLYLDGMGGFYSLSNWLNQNKNGDIKMVIRKW
jgi:hypothetical protein